MADVLRARVKVEPDNDTVHALLTDLKSCSMRRDLPRGRKIHSQAVTNLHDENKYVVTALINMYAKCGSMVEARVIFDSVQNQDLVSWNALLLGYAVNGEGLVALEMFSMMKANGFTPDSLTYVAALKACSSLVADGDVNGKQNCLKLGKEIHAQIGSHMDFYVQSALINMYAKCGSMVDARVVFDSVHNPDVVSWTAMLLGYADNGEGLVCLEMFSRMMVRGCVPNSVTYMAALKACTSLAVNGGKDNCLNCLEWGREIHLQIGCHLDHYVQSTLIDMYAKCGSMAEARGVFDSVPNPNVASWNALILGYADNGYGFVALEVFSRMKVCGCAASSVTYVAALKACTSLAVNVDGSGKENCLQCGRELHSQIASHSNPKVQSTLIDMYAKCGSMVDARNVFDSVRKPDVVSWNALLQGYVENGNGLSSLEMLSRMKVCGCTPDSVTYVTALKACGLIGALSLGRKFHAEINHVDAYLVTCLVDFYGKCGSMAEARGVFDLHARTRDGSTWTALLSGYATFGDSDSVFKLFEAMQDEGFRPDAITFVCMLLCCSHAGLVEKAREYIEEMSACYRITPTVIHYTCMVDVLGRKNRLNEAVLVIRNMPCNTDAVIWRTLLAACRKGKNVKMGKLAFESLLDIDKKDASGHVLMAHIYGSVGMWEEQETLLGVSWLTSSRTPVLNPR